MTRAAPRALFLPAAEDVARCQPPGQAVGHVAQDAEEGPVEGNKPRLVPGDVVEILNHPKGQGHPGRLDDPVPGLPDRPEEPG